MAMSAVDLAKVPIDDVRAARARKTLLNFTKYTKPDYLAGLFHEELARVLDQFLADVVAEKSPRVIIEAPPRHGKTELTSRRFPAYALGRYPHLTFIATSYASDLASSINRDAQRIIDSCEYRRVFPATTLWGKNIRTVADGSYLRNSDIFEVVNNRGAYKSAGVGAGIGGRGGEILLIDDPIKDAAEAASATVRQGIWDWFTSTLYTRAMPGAGILLIMCMTGDTPVLMADGTERLLRDVRVGDAVATYKGGRIASSMVSNWINQGSDLTYEIKTISGKLVKANERHPFLVSRDGGLSWVRVKDLMLGDQIVSVKAPGVEFSAQSMAAKLRLEPRGCATPTTVNHDMNQVKPESPHPKKIGLGECVTATASSPKSLMPCSKSSEEGAPYAETCQHAPTAEHTGLINFVLTIATRLGETGAFYAMIATSLLATEKRKRFCSPQLNICEIGLDEVASITVAGTEDVFDIEVAHTGNFIANGLVSHNTRWHEADLAGRLIDAAQKDGEQWQIVRFPAIAEEDEYSAIDGKLLRKEGEALHPERYPLEALARIKTAVGSRVWASLYQQRPSAAEGNKFKREDWKYFKPTFDLDNIDHELFRQWRDAVGVKEIIQRWDTALGEKKSDDYTACTTLAVGRNKYYVLEVWQKKIEFPEVKREVQSRYDKWRPTRVFVEGGGSASGKATVQAVKRDSVAPIFESITTTDKSLRADTVTPSHEAGLIAVPEGAAWVADFIDACSNFPNAAHDDDVDSFIGAMEEALGHPGPMIITDEFLAAVGAL